MDLLRLLPLLVDHLALADVVRVRAAACARADDDDAGVAHALAARMGLAPRRHAALGALVARVARAGAKRCRECGAVTGRRVRVCAACADSDRPSVALRGRAYARAANRAAPAGRRVPIERLLREAATPVAVTRTGGFLYWKRDLDALLGVPT
jgi:hypothetical protein